MKTINILPSHEAQKIAAGEVVERPASVVKELLENSIDAQSTHISLYIEDGGKKLIRIVDNGHGMSPEDATLCFAPHATSKITSVDELETISSFGFRGEALASISSVSKVTLITQQTGSDMGVTVTIEGADISQPQPVSSTPGCDITIADLFYNTPARKKFLKQTETEWNRILNLFYAFCLSHLSTGFSLYRDGKRVIHAPKVSHLSDRFAQLFGHNVSENLMYLAPSTTDILSLSGVISRHEFWRYNKGMIFFFVNNRLVKNTELLKALMAGYSGILPPGKFPAGCISLTVNTELVDVNVHPRKEEVAFAKPFTITKALQAAVKETLQRRVTHTLTPQPQPQPHSTVSYTALAQDHIERDLVDVPPEPFLSHQAPSQQPQPEPVQENFVEQQEKIKQPTNDITIVGQCFKTYIMIERKDEFVIVDQHAAHERILYEQFASRFEQQDGTRLLFPEIVSLTAEQCVALLAQQTFLNFHGIEIQELDSHKIALTTAPPVLHNNNLREFICEVADYCIEHEELAVEEFKKKLTEHVHSHMACKAAVKAGDELTTTEMYNLVNELSVCNNRMICVHGRPTMWSMPKTELEKKFKRKL